MTLTKLPGSKWWVETNDLTSEIVGTYNKAFITDDIRAIRETLLQRGICGSGYGAEMSVNGDWLRVGWNQWVLSKHNGAPYVRAE